MVATLITRLDALNEVGHVRAAAARPGCSGTFRVTVAAGPRDPNWAFPTVKGGVYTIDGVRAWTEQTRNQGGCGSVATRKANVHVVGDSVRNFDHGQRALETPPNKSSAPQSAHSTSDDDQGATAPRLLKRLIERGLLKGDGKASPR